MGILDNIGGRILLTYRADVSDAKAKLKELSAEERATAKAAIEATEQKNKALEGHINTIKNVTVAVAAVTAAYKIGAAGFEEYQKIGQLTKRAGLTNIDELSKAAGGLRTNVELLTFAAKAQHGALALTQQQMDISIESMRALTKEGFDSSEAFDDVTKAVTTLDTGALEKYGIHVDKVADKHEQLTKLVSALSGETKKFGGDLSDETDSVNRLGVEWDDALSKFKQGIGELVVQLGPLLEALGKVVGVVAGITDLVPGGMSTILAYAAAGPAGAILVNNGKIASFFDIGQGAKDLLAEQNLYKGVTSQLTASLNASAQGDIASLLNKNQSGPADIDPALALRILRAGIAQMTKGARTRPGRGGDAGGVEYGFDPYFGHNSIQSAAANGNYGLGSFGTLRGTTPDGFNGLLHSFAQVGAKQGTTPDGFNGLLHSFAQVGAKQSDFQRAKIRASSIFGPIEEFDAYKTAFGTLTTSITSAFGAWASGASSFGAAWKKAFADGLVGVSVDMQGRALQSAAYALFYLAMGQPAAAAASGKAAAAFEAGSLLVGGLARGLHGGGAAGGGRASGGAAPVLSAGAASGGGKNVTVILGDDFADDSNSRRRARVARAIEMAERDRGTKPSVYAG